MEQGKRGHPILLGCAIVSAIVLVLGVTGGSIGYAFVKSKIAKGGASVAAKFRKDYERAITDGKQSQEQQEVFGELAELAKKPELSIYAIGPVALFFQASLASKEEDQRDCLAAGRDLLEMLKKNPSAGMAEFVEFMRKHRKVLDRLDHYGDTKPFRKQESEGE